MGAHLGEARHLGTAQRGSGGNAQCTGGALHRHACAASGDAHCIDLHAARCGLPHPGRTVQEATREPRFSTPTAPDRAAARRAACRRLAPDDGLGDESGFTLIELVVVIAVLPVVVGAMVAGLLSIMTITPTISNKLSDSGDAEVLSASFTKDVQGASMVTAAAASTSPAACGRGTQLLGLQYPNGQWISYSLVTNGAGPTAVQNLYRNTCQTSGGVPSVTSSAIVSHDVVNTSGTGPPAAMVTCTNSTAASCAGTLPNQAWQTGWVSTAQVSTIALPLTYVASNYQQTMTASPSGGVNSGNPSTLNTSPYNCGFATPNTGTYAGTLCFVDFSGWNPPHTGTPTCGTNGYQIVDGIVDTPFTISFCLTTTGGPIVAAAIPTYTNGGSSAFLGNNGFYTGIPGNPALYQNQEGTNSTVTITNIKVTGCRRRRRHQLEPDHRRCRIDRRRRICQLDGRVGRIQHSDEPAGVHPRRQHARGLGHRQRLRQPDRRDRPQRRERPHRRGDEQRDLCGVGELSQDRHRDDQRPGPDVTDLLHGGNRPGRNLHGDLAPVMTPRSLLRFASRRAQLVLTSARARVLGRHAADDLDSEAGDSLVEVLIAIVVLGMAGVAMLTAFGAAFTSSQEHRNLANIQLAQKSVQQQIVAQLENDSQYVSCAPIATYLPSGSNPVTFTNLPKGYTAQITGVSYWSGSYPFSTNQASCIANSPQLISATVTYPNNKGNSIVSTVVASPTTPASAPSGAAVGLKWYVQPSNTQSAQTMNPPPVVEVVDANGVAVQNDFSTVQLTLNASNGATLAGSCLGKENFGYVTFTGCSINKAGGPYTLTATDTSITGNPTATSGAFSVTVGPPSQLVFSRVPAGASGGTAFTTQPTVTVQDAGGNTVTSDASTATLSITPGTGTAGASLSGCTQSGETAGVISFSGCTINLAGNGYGLTATDGAMTATSATFNVSTGVAAQLVFTQSPTASSSNTAFSQQPVVTVEDAGGNPVNTNASITLAIATQPGTGVTVAGCASNPKTTTGGVASFSGCKITVTTAQEGAYTLKATATGLAQGLSTSFTVAGAPTKLAFVTSPSASVTQVPFPAQPVVWIEDQANDLVTSSNLSVSMNINTQPSSGATLTCSAVTATGGIANFNNCSIKITTTAQQGAYKLGASATGPLTGTSGSFTVAGAATKLAFTQQPSGSSTGGSNFSTQPIVTIQDSTGDTVTNNTSSVSLAITAGTGTSGAKLSCTSLNAVAGVASFSGCNIDKVGNGYTLKATDTTPTTLTAATSTAINVTLGPAAQLTFTTNPGGGANGTALGNQPTVGVQDAGGNAITTATNTISLTIGSQPGSGATLSCSANPVVATGGASTFVGCQIVGTAGSYTLIASSPGLTSGTSTPLTLTAGAAAKLAFTTQPGGGANAATWTTQPAVTVEDSGGNKVTSSTVGVTLSLAQNPGGSLTCTTNPLSATAGVANFGGCKITGIAGTYSLSASSGLLGSATSNSFSITPGAASQLVFTTQPGGGANGAAWTAQPVVSAEDVSGNVVTSFASNVTLAIKTQPGTGTLQCTANPVTASGGVASFAGCEISGTVGNYTLSATSGTLSGTSAAFTVTVGSPAKLVFNTQPGGAVDGVGLGQPASRERRGCRWQPRAHRHRPGHPRRLRPSPGRVRPSGAPPTRWRRAADPPPSAPARSPARPVRMPSRRRHRD